MSRMLLRQRKQMLKLLRRPEDWQERMTDTEQVSGERPSLRRTLRTCRDLKNKCFLQTAPSLLQRQDDLGAEERENRPPWVTQQVRG